MDAREIKQLINHLTPLQRERLKEQILLNRAIRWLQNKPVFSQRRLRYVLDLLDGKEPEPLRRVKRHGHGKVRIIKEVNNGTRQQTKWHG